jgi:hypothetical protein
MALLVGCSTHMDKNEFVHALALQQLPSAVEPSPELFPLYGTVLHVTLHNDVAIKECVYTRDGYLLAYHCRSKDGITYSEYEVARDTGYHIPPRLQYHSFSGISRYLEKAFHRLSEDSQYETHYSTFFVRLDEHDRVERIRYANDSIQKEFTYRGLEGFSIHTESMWNTYDDDFRVTFHDSGLTCVITQKKNGRPSAHRRARYNARYLPVEVVSYASGPTADTVMYDSCVYAYREFDSHRNWTSALQTAYTMAIPAAASPERPLPSLSTPRDSLVKTITPYHRDISYY